MIFHLYRYRLKILLNNRSLMLWTCLLPLIIATVYYFIVYNATEDKSSLTDIPIAIVQIDETQEVGDYLSDIKKSDGTSLFLVTYVTTMEGESLLRNNKVHAYITYDGNYVINIGEKTNRNILKTYLDIYVEKKSLEDGQEIRTPKENGINYVIYSNNTLTSASRVHYFYAILGIACILGSSLGFEEMMDFHSEESKIGMKIQVSTMDKKYLISSNIAALITVHFSALLILLFYLVAILGVISNRNIPIMIAIVFLGSIVGINMGASVFAVFKTNKRVKRAILNTLLVVGSILSGLYYPKINYYIMKEVPGIHYLNPASLVTNSFYNLLYKEDYLKVYVDLSILLSWGILFGVIALSSLRRRNYASI